MKVVKSNIEKILNYYEQAQLYETDFLGFGFHEHNSVMAGKDGCNSLYCWIHKLPIFDVPSSQGTIVANKGDFSFIRIAHMDTRNTETFLNKWKNFLFKKLEQFDIISDDNDWLIDDKKFCGCDGYRLPSGQRIEMCHISMSVNLKVIKNVCIKKWKKQPVGLESYGITQDIMYYWFTTFLKENYPQDYEKIVDETKQ